ncbi:Serine/threonine-protein kinase haspin hrk1 [Vanrija pseudolonga]|uniref:non-specific serine/threonine protein kinase n=1 Tax=Vanrija pseudolonga TaxID=143232 RepID=A0AAF0Y106_9TREE|nr:Serine/threonine-protein kinase haspin hrk1 [Vanrija pseudolonga]
MSLLGLKRIINIHHDLSPERSTPSPALGQPPSPLAPKRPPLQAKMSQDCVPSIKPLSSLKDFANTPLKQPAKKLDKGKAARAPATPERDLVKKHAVPRARKVVIPRSPVSTPRRSTVEVVIPTPRHFAPLRDVGLATSSRYRDAPTATRVEDITEHFERVTIRDTKKPKRARAVQPPKFSAIDTLLSSCLTATLLPFGDVFTSEAFGSVLPGGRTSTPVIRKIGEASYSEVFTVASSTDDEAIVVKIIPLLGDKPVASTVELPDCSEVADVVREVETTKRMSSVPGGGFGNFLGAFVVHGCYPQLLLQAWDEFDEESEWKSLRPDVFGESQQYAVVALSNGGQDLEGYKFEASRGWVQAASAFWQVADALGRAEKWTGFEHRDLHEGQILVSAVPPSTPPQPITNYLDSSATAVRATIIDFGLSRLEIPGHGSTSTPLPDEVYEGVGNQWDVYRAMRDRIESADDAASDAWTAFHPITNVLWLHYLARRLLRSTPTLRKPREVKRSASSVPKKGALAEKEVIRARSEAAWHMLVAVEAALGVALSVRDNARVAARKLQQFASAEEFAEWGRQQGWIA